MVLKDGRLRPRESDNVDLAGLRRAMYMSADMEESTDWHIDMTSAERNLAGGEPSIAWNGTDTSKECCVIWVVCIK